MIVRPAATLVFVLVACLPAGVTQPTGAPPAVTAAPTATVAPATPAPSPTPGATPSPTPAPETAQCGHRVTKSFVLANDMTCSGDALVVAANGVTVDLNGKLLKGPGYGPQTWPSPQLHSVGIRAEDVVGITVRNGRISDFSTGVYFMRVRGSVIEAVVSQRSRFGIYVHHSDGNTVRRSRTEANIYGLHLQNANDTLIERNVLARQTYNSPGGYGIYLYASQRNRITENDIEGNVNWGIWFSEASGNLIFHNNVAGNNPQVSDSSDRNQWFDPVKKQGNFWGDYRGTDRDGDGIGDRPYAILGAGGTVDAYPFMERNGWTKKAGPTIDHWQPPVAEAPRQVRVAALAGGSLVSASPREAAAADSGLRASAIALGTDGRTVYALDGQTLRTIDLPTGAVSDPVRVSIGATQVVANRNGRSAFLIGPRAGEQIDLTSGRRTQLPYDGTATAVAASYKHNQMFIATRDGIDMLYISTAWTGNIYTRGGHVPYTIPLGGQPAAMTMNGSGTRIYASVDGTGEIQVVDTEQLAVVDRLTVGADARALAVDRREGRLYVGTADGLLTVDLAKRELLRRVPMPGRVSDVVLSPNGDEVYVGLASQRIGIAVVRADDLAVAAVIDLAAAPVRLLVISYH
jgi:parallel beta-helix repeat protein